MMVDKIQTCPNKWQLKKYKLQMTIKIINLLILLTIQLVCCALIGVQFLIKF